MSMIDGVNKFFIVTHSGTAMHFDGFKSQREIVEQVMRYADYSASVQEPRNTIMWLESLKPLIDEYVLEIKQDYELDGHKAPVSEEWEGDGCDDAREQPK